MILKQRITGRLPQTAALWRIAVAVLLIAMLLHVGTAYAEETRSFEITEVNIHARIDHAGNMHVTESDTYRFDGAFNGIIVELNASGSDGLEQFEAYEVEGEQLTRLRAEMSQDGDKLLYHVYSSSHDETKMYRFSYIVKNVIQVYPDTAQLYWKFFDPSNPTDLEDVAITISLPEGVKREEIQAFGHGPLYGEVHIEDNGSVSYKVALLSSGEMLEVRVLLPQRYVPGSTRVSPTPMLEQIMEEERIWTEQTAAELADQEAAGMGLLVLLLVNIVGGFILYFRFSRDPRPEWNGRYYREIPADVSPAVVSYLMNYRLKPKDLIATLIDLVRRRHARMEAIPAPTGTKEKMDFSFKLTNRPVEQLQAHEQMLMDWLFNEIGSQGQVTLQRIQAYAADQQNASVFLKRWLAWKQEVIQAVNQRHYIQYQKSASRFVILTALGQLFGFWIFAPENWQVLMYAGIPLLLFKPRSKRRTVAGATARAKWKAFKRFLRDYSQIASREPMAVHLWNHFFVYAIALGEAKRMIKTVDMKMPEASSTDYTDISYLSVHYYEDWTDSFQQSLSGATSANSSSSDGDGSFSSGGGGGRGAF